MPINEKEFLKVILISALFGANVGFVGTGAGLFVRDKFEKKCVKAPLLVLLFSPSSSEKVS